jgi:hypothetical protein
MGNDSEVNRSVEVEGVGEPGKLVPATQIRFLTGALAGVRVKEFLWALSTAVVRFVRSFIFAAHKLPFQDSCPEQGRPHAGPYGLFDSASWADLA